MPFLGADHSTVLVLDWRAWQHNYSFGREIGESNQLLSEVTNPNNPYPIHALLRASLPAERSPQAERTHRRHPLPKLSLPGLLEPFCPPSLSAPREVTGLATDQPADDRHCRSS